MVPAYAVAMIHQTLSFLRTDVAVVPAGLPATRYVLLTLTAPDPHWAVNAMRRGRLAQNVRNAGEAMLFSTSRGMNVSSAWFARTAAVQVEGVRIGRRT